MDIPVGRLPPASTTNELIIPYIKLIKSIYLVY
jgi:hypothetical protein